jgi:hypothetical protein
MSEQDHTLARVKCSFRKSRAPEDIANVVSFLAVLLQIILTVKRLMFVVALFSGKVVLLLIFSIYS